MVSDIRSRRVPWVALALSLLSAGVGHVYCGRIAKGLPLYFAWLLVPLGVAVAAVLPPSPTSLVSFVLLPVAIVCFVYVYAAVDAWRLADQIGSDYSLRDFNRAAIYLLLIVVQMIYAVGLVAGVRGWVYEAFRIPSSSMSPTLIAGDRFLARKLLARDHFPERGELIVYRSPSPPGATRYVGRVIAVSGDHLEIRGERVIVNGNELERDRVPNESLGYLGEEAKGRIATEQNSGSRYLVAYGDSADDKRPKDDLDTTIPDRHVFVLGDNRDHSKDSRHFGPIPMGDIVGDVEYIYWPAKSWSRFGVADDRLP